MSKLQLILLALFILGLVGAVNSITNQSTLEKEKGFLNGVLSLFGLTYEAEPEPAREFDFVPGKVTSEVSKLSQENLKGSPSPDQNQTAQPATTPNTSTSQQNTPSPTPSTSNQYNFTFSNEVPIPPVAPNQQTLGVKDQNILPIPPLSPSTNTNNQKPPIPPVSPSSNPKYQEPPIPPVSPNQQSSSTSKSADIINTILNLLTLN